MKPPPCKNECKQVHAPGCNATEKHSGYGCTRNYKHRGPHVACGHSDHAYAVWVRERAKV